MGQILIRNLDDSVVEALRRRAAEHGVSLEQEARTSLAAAVGLTRENALARLDLARARIGRPEGPSSLDDLKRDRRRDG